MVMVESGTESPFLWDGVFRMVAASRMIGKF
jgi:hypothetical protein